MRQTALFFIFLFLLSCLGQMASDLYLATLPTLQKTFHTSVSMIQMSVALFMYGFAASHLIYGPISDGIGRKRPLIIGMVIAILGTILCEYATSITFFLSGRLLQGTGAGAAATLFRSILRDLYSGNRLAKISSFIGISRVFLLASSPLIGGYLLHCFGWRSCFFFLLIYSGGCFIGTLFLLKETHLDRNDHSLYSIVKNTMTLLKHPLFMSYSFCAMFTFGGIVAWLTSLPIILQTVIGLTPVQFGWICAITGLFFIVGGFINAMVVERLGLEYMIKVGLIIMLLSGVVMLWFGLQGTLSLLVIMLPVITYITGSSIIFANAYAGAFDPFPKMAGTAGAIFGFLQILGGALSSMFISLSHSYNQIPLATTLIISALAALLIITMVSAKAPQPAL